MPSNRMPEIGMPWLVSGSGAADGAALGGRAAAAAWNVGVALGTAVGAVVAVASVSAVAVALGSGVALGVPPWSNGSDGPSSEPTINTYTGLVRTGSPRPSQVASA